MKSLTTLHILRSSPYSSKQAENTLRLARPGDGIVLMHDAVVILRSSPKSWNPDDLKSRGLKIFAIRADLEARSVKAPFGVEEVDYDEFVNLITQYQTTVS